MTDQPRIEQQAKLAEIIERLMRALPVDEQARILAIGHDTTAPTPFRVLHNGGVNSVDLRLADGTLRHIGEFDASELDEPLADDE